MRLMPSGSLQTEISDYNYVHQKIDLVFFYFFLSCKRYWRKDLGLIHLLAPLLGHCQAKMALSPTMICFH